MPSNHDQRQAAHISRRRFPHPHCSVRVGGLDYEVPIPNRSGWTANAPPRKGFDWFPSPRMKGETAELSKLMQNKREVTLQDALTVAINYMNLLKTHLINLSINQKVQYF